MGPPRFQLSSSPFFAPFLASAPLLSLALLALLLLLLPLASAVDTAGWTVRPSNNSADLSWTAGLRFHLNSSQVLLPASSSLAPLTPDLVDLDQTELARYRVRGSLVDVDATNSVSLSSQDIAVISCDPAAYSGNLDASATLSNVLTAQQQAIAVVLYSATSVFCNYTSDDPSANRYINVFSLVNPTLTGSVQSQLSAPGNGSTVIAANTNMSSIGSTPLSTSNESNGSPNTAMIILYSITGIITALFLAIIVTGAVRAHRHPERYGPRYTAGRPRQSRARGIARAMLDTIPIVKFGDATHEGKPEPKGDVEMGEASEEQPAHEIREGETAATTTTTIAPSTEQQHHPDHSETSNPTESNDADNEPPTDHPNFACPICTDDFIKGQDMRVLPCNHQFHPECIDPWLVNVSGTCPLCRIDLNPLPQEGDEHDLADGHHGPTAEGAPEPAAEGSHHRHRRFSSYLQSTLNERRMRDASVEERLLALRIVRQQATADPNPDNTGDSPDERLRRRSRLTARLRERFRVRTRSHGAPAETDTAAAAEEETPPA